MVLVAPSDCPIETPVSPWYIEADFYQRRDVLEAENYSLTQQIKQLENVLDKEKKFHRKFVEDVIQSEELRNLDFEKERKELLADKKRLAAENRQLKIDNIIQLTTNNMQHI
ncbi:hypothetical protein Bhyg_00441, partial [Pseudolycoriella hygida]